MKLILVLFWSCLFLFFSSSVLALDSYRYLHVTIDTPWYIFIFLLPLVLSPFIIMAILYWWFAWRNKSDDNNPTDTH